MLTHSIHNEYFYTRRHAHIPYTPLPWDITIFYFMHVASCQRRP